MTAPEFALFETPIGSCGIAWNPRGIVCVQLPEAGVAATRARMRQRLPGAHETTPPPKIRRSIAAIVGLLGGKRRDLSELMLDMADVPPFHRRVYEAARSIEPGQTLTYGEVAARVGAPGAARAVGQALGKNPFAIVVPCHRVLAAGGKLGGFSANGGLSTKLRMLSIEGVDVDGGRVLTNGDGAFGFDPKAALKHLRKSDPALARLIAEVGPFRMQLKKTHSIFFALAEAIVHQQLNGKAAATIFGRVCDLFPNKASFSPAQLLRASDDALRGAGLSRSKLSSLRDLATRAKRGELPTLEEIHRMQDEAIIERLTEVRGIGRWTAEMLLMFRLGRPDVLPVDDYGVRKGFALTFRTRELPSKGELDEHGARWRPYRTVASWYLWRALEL